MQIVFGPVLTRKGGYAFDCWTREEGLSRGYAYGRIEDAHYARNVEIRIVVPEAYVIHAQAPDGSKIVMEISPDQMQAVIERTGSSSRPSSSTTRKSRPFETHSIPTGVREGVAVQARHLPLGVPALIATSATRPAGGASRSGERHREIARRATIRNSARRPASPSFTEFYPV
jgi:hypothetical protein